MGGGGGHVGLLLSSFSVVLRDPVGLKAGFLSWVFSSSNQNLLQSVNSGEPFLFCCVHQLLLSSDGRVYFLSPSAISVSFDRKERTVFRLVNLTGAGRSSSITEIETPMGDTQPRCPAEPR